MERERALGQKQGQENDQNHGEWHEVTRKKSKEGYGASMKTDIATHEQVNSRRDTTTFYFTEFPETHGAKEMLRAFQLYGEATEVVIPAKRDRNGRRFGFVRFRNVKDHKTFGIKLDNIIFGATKIHVNPPRYRRVATDWKGEQTKGKWSKNEQQRRVIHQQKTLPRPHVQPKWRWVEKGKGDSRREKKTYADMLTGKGRNLKTAETNVVYYRKNNITEMRYNVAEEEMNKFKKMYIGVVKMPGSTHYVHEWFNMQGFFSIKFTPLGANKVLMEEMEEGVIQELLTDYNDWIYAKFDDIRKWSEAEGDDERVVWLRCHGIPAHAWNNEFFERLAGKFGVLLGVDEDTRKMTSMEVARLRIRTKSYDVFNMVVEAYINNFRCDIKVVEEWCGPLYWIDQSKARENDNETVASEEDSEPEDEGPPLFTAEDGGYESLLDDEEEEQSPESKNSPIIVEKYEAQPITHGSNDCIEKENRRSNDNDVEEVDERGEHGEVNSHNLIGGDGNVGVKGGERNQPVEVEISQTGDNIVSGGVHKEGGVVENTEGCNSKSRGCEEERCRGKVGGLIMKQAQRKQK